MPPESSGCAARFPEELIERRQWVNWQTRQRDGRSTKLPYSSCSRQLARTDSPETWGSFEQAVEAANTFDGIGFVFTEDDPYVGIDLDKVLDEDGAIEPWAKRLLTLLPPECYVEVSPSGRGLHVILKGRKPGPKCKRTFGDCAVEIYEHRRYFTMTGRPWRPPPVRIADGQEALDEIYRRLFVDSPAPASSSGRSNGQNGEVPLLERAFSSKAGERIRALWGGDFSSYGSRSEADLALCSHLAFWASGDLDEVDRLFRESGLMREKWLRDDYRRATLEKAASRNEEVGKPDPGVAQRITPSSRIKGDQDDDEAAVHGNTHLANAGRLARQFRSRLRWVSGMGFLVFTGRRWRFSDSQARGIAAGVGRIVSEEAAGVSTEAARAASKEERENLNRKAETLNAWARTSEQGPAIRESLKLAEPMLELDSRQLDRHPLLLNVENGTLDLETGTLRPHEPADFLTKMAPVRFDPEARAPLWQQFIAEIMNFDEPTIRYVQAALGYSMTGLAREQCLFLAHGRGQNGKSTLLDVMRLTLGDDYVTKAPPDLLIQTRGERAHPAEIAALRGARLVVSQEVTRGKAFDTQKVKELTGERWLKARHLYGNFFDFKVTFTLWLAVNDLPVVHDNSTAFWRRVHCIPFSYTIPKPRRDFDLVLAGESPGILNWLLEGAQRYLREGLACPEDLRRAVEVYRTDSDSLGEFIQARCVVGEEHEVKASELWEAYASHTAECGGARVKKREFKSELHSRGFGRPPRRSEGYFYTGLALRPMNL